MFGFVFGVFRLLELQGCCTEDTPFRIGGIKDKMTRLSVSQHVLTRRIFLKQYSPSLNCVDVLCETLLCILATALVYFKCQNLLTVINCFCSKAKSRPED